MERKRISISMVFGKYIVLVTGLLCLFVFIKTLGQAEVTFGLLFFVLGAGGLFYIMHNAKTVEFDDRFMYVKSRSGENAIPLENVYSIKRAMIRVNMTNVFKIGYRDGVEEITVRILPRFPGLKLFKEAVELKNPSITVEPVSFEL